MTNDKHTGGRWFVYLAGHRREVRSDAGGLPGGIGLHIATVIRDEKGPAEMDADAHLMAAAPDMLRALRAAVAQGNHADDCAQELDNVVVAHNVNRPLADCSCWMGPARAAIAKAEGR